MTREPRHRNRLITRRPRTSTLVLIGLFLGFLALYIVVAPPTTSNTGNVQQVNPTQAPTTPAYTQAPRHSTTSPAPSHSPTPSATNTPSHTPTPTTSTGTGTASPTTSATTTGVTSPASPPGGSPVQ